MPASDDATGNGAVYDFQEVVDRLMLPEDMLIGFLKNFIETYANVSADLGALIESGNTDDAAEMAHSVKGVAANLGAARLSENAAELERLLRDGDTASAAAMMPAFSETADATVAAMKVVAGA